MSDLIGQALPLLTQLVGAAQGAAGGGLPALLAQLENAGLGAEVRSWIGHEENLPVTAGQLGSVFPPEQVEAWAKEAGTTPDAVLRLLAEALPRLVHHATPEGTLPVEETRLSHFVHKVLGR
jgi:uncharacterized protein YidB (DUF937 family)